MTEPGKAELAVRLRKLENTGRPLGEEGFVESLAQQIGSDITTKKPGPKPKVAN